jgi:hypothetical protein
MLLLSYATLSMTAFLLTLIPFYLIQNGNRI